jgi:hypothetical protein
MKSPLPLLAALVFVVSVRAQAPENAYAPEQLDQLLAPIALYPDPLVALILPASTAPADVAQAAQYLSANGAPAGIDSQAWDPSVKALAHYPSVLEWMNTNADWMHALGAAFAMQPSDVLKSIQQLRAKARAAGTLVDTPQQRIDIEGDEIRIVPAQDSEIFVPQYDPDSAYDEPTGDAGPYLTFGVGYPVGPWLGYECDWDDFGIWYGPWQSGWAYRRDWRNPGWGGNRWHPDARRGHELVRSYYRPMAEVPHARPIAGARVIGRPAEARPAAARPAMAGPQARPDYRGWNGVGASAPRTPAPASPLFGTYGRGTQTRDFSNRGHASRQAPVNTPSRGAGGHSAAPAPAPAGRERH